MARIPDLRTRVEQAIQQSLSERNGGATFVRRSMKLKTGGKHDFSAVADSPRCVASIKTGTGRAGATQPLADITQCITELYFLSLVRADQRWLVLTSAEFYNLFDGLMYGKLPSGVEVIHLPLPPELQTEAEAAQWSTNDDAVPTLDDGERRVFSW